MKLVFQGVPVLSPLKLGMNACTSFPALFLNLFTETGGGFSRVLKNVLFSDSVAHLAQLFMLMVPILFWEVSCCGA